MVDIECLDVQPERDSYRGGDAITVTELWLDPEERCCGVHQWQPLDFGLRP